MPNIIAYTVLLLWPLAIVLMFRKFSPERAFIWAILGGYLLLPEATEFNFPMVPPFDKVTLPNLTAFVVCVAMLGLRIRILPESALGKICLAMMLMAPILAVLTNTDQLRFGETHHGNLTIVHEQVEPIPGMRIYDAISVLARQMIILLPFFLARNLLVSASALTEFLRALVIAGLIYSIPMLWEFRFSPQLHTQIYGFFQHSFAQMIRQGGFRPIVFMPHGLWLAFFAVMAAIAALHFARQASAQDRPKAAMIALWLAAMMVVTRSLGPQMIFVALAPLVLFFGPHMQLRVATGAACVAITYPLLRGAELFNIYRVSDWLAERNPERAHSLAFRFFNEELLLDRASERALFGWGSWGRNMVYNPITGENTTISDGLWVIVIGQFGWIGYLGTFGLLCLPLFLLWWHYRRMPAPEVPPQVGVVALLLGANLFDLLPNATLVPLTWLMAGALLGHAEAERAKNRAEHARQIRTSPGREGLLASARLEAAPTARDARRSKEAGL